MSVAKSHHVEVSSVAMQANLDHRQRQRMLVALALLLIALIVVIAKDHEFWFPSSSVADTEDISTPDSATTGTANHKAKTTAHAVPARPVAKSETKIETAAPASAPVVARTPLPPLEVEVVSGDQHRTIPTRNPSIQVELQAPGSNPAGTAASVTNPAAERVRLSPNTLQVVSRPVQPNYPLLAKQMKVQGSVILEALIGRDGLIQDLQVLSGPTILSDAARQAVKQWRFKPYLQSGQAVETEARITVNFTISTD